VGGASREGEKRKGAATRCLYIHVMLWKHKYEYLMQWFGFLVFYFVMLAYPCPEVLDNTKYG
jgi:hypothetical protein